MQQGQLPLHRLSVYHPQTLVSLGRLNMPLTDTTQPPLALDMDKIDKFSNPYIVISLPKAVRGFNLA